MAALPTPHTLAVRRLTEGATDAHGNPIRAWGDPLPWAVHGYAPGASDLTSEANRDGAIIRWTVYAPTTEDAPNLCDLVRIDGTDYALSSPPADWTNSPWPHPTAGLAVELVDVEG